MQVLRHGGEFLTASCLFPATRSVMVVETSVPRLDRWKLDAVLSRILFSCSCPDQGSQESGWPCLQVIGHKVRGHAVPGALIDKVLAQAALGAALVEHDTDSRGLGEVVQAFILWR